MTNIPNPHDKLFRYSLKNLAVAKDFFKAHLPEFMLNKINFASLKFCDTSFLDEELKEQASDVLYYSKLTNDADSYIYLLTEHQSSPKKFMPLRMLRYQLAIIMQHLQEHPQATKLPIVFPILFYQQQKDKNRILNLAALMEYLQKHARDRDLLLVINDLKRLILDTEKQIGNNEILLVTYVESCLYYILLVGNISDPKEFITQLNSIPVVREKIMGTVAKILIKQGRREGRQEGREEGIELGIKRGREEGIKNTALAMLQEGADLVFISKVTKLTIEEIQRLNRDCFATAQPQ